MKKTLSILLSVLYVSLLFAPLIPYAEYAMHKEHIMLHYCKNPVAKHPHLVVNGDKAVAVWDELIGNFCIHSVS